MATGQVSSITGDTWQLISTTTMAGATSYTVSSLTGYKTLMVAVTNGVKSTADYFSLRLNGDTAIGNYAGNGGGDSYYNFSVTSAAASAATAVIYDTNQSAPHRMEITGYTAQTGNFVTYIDPTPITSISISTPGGTATLNSGTIKVYGIAA